MVWRERLARIALAIAALAMMAPATRAASAPSRNDAATVRQFCKAGDQCVTVQVRGVAIPFTAFGILKRLHQIPGVTRVRFNLTTGLAIVSLRKGARLTDQELREAVIDASYTPGKIVWIDTDSGAAAPGVNPIGQNLPERTRIPGRRG